MKYHQLSSEERFFIDVSFNQERKTISKIAKELNRNKSTISREIKRNTRNGVYQFETANKMAKVRSWHNHSMYLLKYEKYSKLFLKTYDKRVRGVKATCNTLKNKDVKKVSWRQVFNWIKSNRWKLKKSDRLRPYYVKGKKRKIGIFSKLNSKYVLPIWVRPKYIDLRQDFGHWEGDLIIGKKANNYDNILVLTERKTRYTLITKIKSKNPHTINKAIKDLFQSNNAIVKSLTLDNGIEFEKIGLIGYWLNIKIYMCNPYASYERGSNENWNGLFRRYYKKGTDFNEISLDEIKNVQDEINSMPREMFNWISSKQFYESENLHK